MTRKKVTLAKEEKSDTSRMLWTGPIGFEDVLTGDLRYIESEALTWSDLPLPLRYVKEDFGAHDGAVVVGLIYAIERQDDGTIFASGTIEKDTEEGREIANQVEKGMLTGVSMDLDNVVVEAVPHTEFVADADADSMVAVMTQAQLRAATMVSIPAFDKAHIKPVTGATTEQTQGDLVTAAVESLTELFSQSEDNPQPAEGETFDSSGLPNIFRQVIDKLSGINDPSRAVLPLADLLNQWAQGKEEVTESVRLQAAKAYAEWCILEASTSSTLVASGLVGDLSDSPPREWFYRPELSGPTPLTVTPEGRIYGHLATWGTCHVAHPDTCTQPPQSKTGYSYFHTGLTHADNGDLVPTGHITLDTGHANPHATAAAATSHYENTGAVVADICVGEDEHGIWFAGAIRDLDPKTYRKLQASPLSGDWRNVNNNLELVAALAVNVPGFPVPRATGALSAGQTVSLVASGMVPPLKEGKLSDSDKKYFETLRHQSASYGMLPRQEQLKVLRETHTYLNRKNRVHRTAMMLRMEKLSKEINNGL